MNLQKPKGTKDYFGLDAKRFFAFSKLLDQIAKKYGFEKITFPTFENTQLFIRSVGEESDIVTKEIYTFNDKGNRSISLRPEGTASVVRMVIENKLVHRNEIQQFYYFEPMFRYERPQSGRQREFYQFGIEVFGDDSINKEVELIQFASEILSSLKIEFNILINSLGTIENRTNYIKALKTFLEKDFDLLSEDSKKRFKTNPLRILDSKEPIDQKILQNAPKLEMFLGQEELKRFNSLKEKLNHLGIKYKIDSNLVRGLDYYNDLVFEFVSKETNLTLIGGGRYDSLINHFEPKLDIKAIGFGAGIERILLNSKQDFNDDSIILIGSLDKQNSITLLKYASKMRLEGYNLKVNNISKKYDSLVKKAKEDNIQKVWIIDETSNYLYKIDLLLNQKNKEKLKE